MSDNATWRKALFRPGWASLLVLVLAGGHVLWDYWHGGVPVHHLLADEAMPGISNAWGLLTLSLLTWLVMIMIRKRTWAGSQLTPSAMTIGWRFLMAVGLGLIASMLWEFDLDRFLPFVMLLPVVISLFVRVYYPECLLGFVLAMAYTFGGVLPIGFGLILLTLSWVVHQTLGRLLRWGIDRFKP